MTPDLQTALDKANARVAAMSPEQRDDMWRKQRQSFIRGMTTPCEHGVLDFEQCGKCRAEAQFRFNVSEMVGKLTHIQKRALEELCVDYGRGPRHLSANLLIPEKEAREILRFFRQEGICDYGCLMREDESLLAGKGYWLGKFGHAVRAQVREQPW